MPRYLNILALHRESKLTIYYHSSSFANIIKIIQVKHFVISPITKEMTQLSLRELHQSLTDLREER